MVKIPWWKTHFGEEEVNYITDSIRQGYLSLGPVTLKFEQQLAELLDIPYVIATTSGSAALLMALMALDIKSGDEVIVPNRTWIATAHAPMMLGAKVVLVDVKSDLPIIDVSQIRQKITSRTRAIIPVCLNGRAVDMEEVWKISDEYGLKVIEDAAQGLFSKNSGKYMGTQSDAGCFSLSMAKLIPTGQGGFVVTRNKETYEKLILIRTHGVVDTINCRFDRMGFNFRYTDLQASIGIAQLAKAEKRIADIKGIYEKYKEGLAEFPFLQLIPVNVLGGEIPLYVEALCSDRERLISFLSSKGIQTRPFYPDLDTADHLGCFGEFPNSKIFGRQGLVLPCGPDQSIDNIKKVLNELNNFKKKI
jgi:perosamine synthetase